MESVQPSNSDSNFHGHPKNHRKSKSLTWDAFTFETILPSLTEDLDKLAKQKQKPLSSDSLDTLSGSSLPVGAPPKPPKKSTGTNSPVIGPLPGAPIVKRRASGSSPSAFSLSNGLGNGVDIVDMRGSPLSLPANSSDINMAAFKDLGPVPILDDQPGQYFRSHSKTKSFGAPTDFSFSLEPISEEKQRQNPVNRMREQHPPHKRRVTFGGMQEFCTEAQASGLEQFSLSDNNMMDWLANVKSENTDSNVQKPKGFLTPQQQPQKMPKSLFPDGKSFDQSSVSSQESTASCPIIGDNKMNNGFPPQYSGSSGKSVEGFQKQSSTTVNKNNLGNGDANIGNVADIPEPVGISVLDHTNQPTASPPLEPENLPTVVCSRCSTRNSTEYGENCASCHHPLPLTPASLEQNRTTSPQQMNYLPPQNNVIPMQGAPPMYQNSFVGVPPMMPNMQNGSPENVPFNQFQLQFAQQQQQQQQQQQRQQQQVYLQHMAQAHYLYMQQMLNQQPQHMAEQPNGFPPMGNWQFPGMQRNTNGKRTKGDKYQNRQHSSNGSGPSSPRRNQNQRNRSKRSSNQNGKSNGPGYSPQNGGPSTNLANVCDCLAEYKSSGRRPSMEELNGHVVEFSKDSHGSRFIQFKMEIASDEERQVLIEEVLDDAVSLMQDTFGNYVIQKFIEHGSPSQRVLLSNTMCGSMYALSAQAHGCRVVQRAFDLLDIQQRNKLLAELLLPEGNVFKCARNSHATHVLQKAVNILIDENRCQSDARKVSMAKTRFSDAPSSFELLHAVEEAVYKSFEKLSLHAHSYRLVLHILGDCSPSLSPWVEKMMERVKTIQMSLATDQHGNFILQHILDKGSKQQAAQVQQFVAENVLELSQHKFGSHLVEKCLDCATQQQAAATISQLLKPTENNKAHAKKVALSSKLDGKKLGMDEDTARNPLVLLMQDPYANFVVQKAFDKSVNGQRKMLYDEITSRSDLLSKFTYGRHILSFINKGSKSGGKN